MRRSTMPDAAALRNCTQLEFIRLDGTNNLTDAGLVHLEGLTNLKQAVFDGSFVTQAGAARLQAKLPNCKITVAPRAGTPPVAAPVAPAAPSASPAEVDLLALVQLPRDAVDGEWTRNGTALQVIGVNHRGCGFRSRRGRRIRLGFSPVDE